MFIDNLVNLSATPVEFLESSKMFDCSPRTIQEYYRYADLIMRVLKLAAVHS